LTKYSKETYQEQFSNKKILFTSNIDPATSKEFFTSEFNGFRFRAEFKALKVDDEIFYGMTIDGKKKIIDSFPIVSASIQNLMPSLLIEINKYQEISEKLFQIEFQASRNEEIMVSLIYHKELDSNWVQTAKGIADKLSISIIGRSKKQVVVLGTNYITENYRFLEREFPLRLYEQCFSQTNPVICDAMLNWVAMNAPSQNADIMELHCGLGTFTIPLSFLYKKVLATENSRPSIRALEKNIEANKRKNIFFGRLSGKETLEAHKGIREFKRLNSLNLDEFNFETIFLDPPREGLDGNTLKDLKEFKNIIYISCGFDSFIRDLSELRKTHRIIKTAMFDKFPYTEHIESGAILSRIAPN